MKQRAVGERVAAAEQAIGLEQQARQAETEAATIDPQEQR